MDYCTIKRTPKSLTLLEMSGSSEYQVLSTIGYFQEEFGRNPKLDEIPEANSEPHLRKRLNIKGDGYTSKSKMLEEVAASSIEEALILLNKEYSDLFINIIDLGGDAVLIKTLQRPTIFTDNPVTFEADMDFDEDKNKIVLLDALESLRRFGGHQIVHITNEDILKTPELRNLLASLANAFIYNGTIYINSDNAKINAPIHEMLHLFIGSIRFNNPQLYTDLLLIASLSGSLKRMQKYYPNRTMNDLLEEVFVEELSKFLSGMESTFDNLNKTLVSEMVYNIKRDIDTILNGLISVKSLRDSTIYGSSIMQLAKKVGSKLTTLNDYGNLTDDVIHRMLANTKEELLKNNELEQICE